MRGYLLVNPRSGSRGWAGDDLRREARRLGLQVRVLSPEDDVQELAGAAEAEALGVAGGDGSLAPVAAAALERGLPFVCVPFGTRNHFARDLGLDPDDPAAALAAFEGAERRVDAARVGGRLFLNNVSLGIYGALVHRREHHRKRRQALASARALGLAARERRPVPVTVDGRPLAARVVLVASNAYDLDLFSLGERPRLDEGKLHLYAATGLLPRRWEERRGERFLLDSPVRRLRAAIDGEPAELEAPLDFTIDAGALRVLVPGR